MIDIHAEHCKDQAILTVLYLRLTPNLFATAPYTTISAIFAQAQPQPIHSALAVYTVCPE